MSLIKEYNVYSNKPINEDRIISELHQKYKNSQKDFQKNCPSCKNVNYNFAFDKYSFHYVQCTNCMSLYVQNGLCKDKLSEYEKNMKSDFYSTKEYKKYVDSVTNKISFELELTFSRLFSKKKKMNILYFGNKRDVYKNGLKTFNANFYDSNDIINGKFDLVIIDHFIEKQNKLDTFMQEICKLLTDDGFLYITMRVGSGIDILTLWEDSKIYPLEHNKLLSIDGIKILLKENQFELKELNTPGILDIKNIINTKSNNIPRFLNYLDRSDNQKAIEEFQTFIQKNLLSSFATIIAKKEMI